MYWFYLLAFVVLVVAAALTFIGKSKVVVEIAPGVKVLTTLKTACALNLSYLTPGKVRYVTNYTIATVDKDAHKFWLLNIYDLGDVVINLAKIKGIKKIACSLDNKPYLFYDEVNGVVSHFNIKA